VEGVLKLDNGRRVVSTTHFPTCWVLSLPLFCPFPLPRMIAGGRAGEGREEREEKSRPPRTQEASTGESRGERFSFLAQGTNNPARQRSREVEFRRTHSPLETSSGEPFLLRFRSVTSPDVPLLVVSLPPSSVCTSLLGLPNKLSTLAKQATSFPSLFLWRQERPPFHFFGEAIK